MCPSLALPRKLKGEARATFTQNTILALGCRDGIAALRQAAVPVLLAKGAALCLVFAAWSRRRMGDVDVHVPEERLTEACTVLEREGWTPRYGMTWRSLVARTARRRESWNFTKGTGDLDLHWRLADGPGAAAVDGALWRTALPVDFRGIDVLRPSPEFALLSSLQHGFLAGSRADLLQMVVDADSWLRSCRTDELAGLLARGGLLGHYRLLQTALLESGSDAPLPELRLRPLQRLRLRATLATRRPRERGEEALLRRPRLHALWCLLGRRGWIERALLRAQGPFSKPLAPPCDFKDEYDLRDCSVMDAVGGPGWGWPEPEHTCFWSDRADARLLVPLRRDEDHVIVLRLGAAQQGSANPSFRIYANGHELGRCSSGDLPLAVVLLKRSQHAGAWVELSFRPHPYPDLRRRQASVQARRCLAASRLLVVEMPRLAAIFDQTRIWEAVREVLLGKQPITDKFARIRGKAEVSPFRTDPGLPTTFDPLAYVLLHPDLLEHEVEPYEHFLNYGREEGRRW